MWLLAQVQTGTLVLLAAVGLTSAVLLVRSNRGLRRRPSQVPPVVHTQRPQAVRAQRRQPPTDELNRWEVDMQELARDLKADLDGKMGVLQHLIRSGAALADRLETLLERTEVAAAAGSPRQATERPRATPSRSLTHPATQAAALAVATLTTAARRASSVATAAVATPAAVAAPSDPLRRFDEIYALADAGCDSATIAGNTGSPIGEVELILSLRER